MCYKLTSTPDSQCPANSRLQLKPNQMTSFYFLLLPTLLLFFLLLKSKTNFSKRNHIRLPPGPWTLPIIGSLHHLSGRSSPHRALHRLSQRHGSLMFLQLGERPTVVVSSREAAREIMKTHDLKFCSRPVNSATHILTYGKKGVVFAPYGEYWRTTRKICVMDLFNTKRVQSFRSIREEEVANLIEWVSSYSSARKSLDLSERLFFLANDVTVRSIMGRKSKDQDLLMREVKSAIEVAAEFDIVNMFPSSHLARMLSTSTRRAEEFTRTIARLFECIIEEHREKVGDGDAKDLLMALLRLHDENSENKLSMDTIKAIIFDVIAAGTDTTGATLDWAMVELMKHPRVMNEVQTELRQRLRGHKTIVESDLTELKYLQFIIKETLRLHPPAAVVTRECQQTCEILGYNIPEGTSVIVNAWAIARDSNYWQNAEEFKPERFAEFNSDVDYTGEDFAFIPFGAGRRVCPGMSMGLVTVELALANLLYHFNWELPPGMNSDELDMTETFGITACRKSPLCLHAIPYKF